MATTSANPYNGYASTPQVLPNAMLGYAAKIIVFRAVITFAAQASADVIQLCKIPKGLLPLYGILNNDTSTATATIAIGNATTAGKYRAAAVKTTTNAPEVFGVVAANMTSGAMVPLAADEVVLATVGTASLPASGFATVDIFCASL